MYLQAQCTFFVPTARSQAKHLMFQHLINSVTMPLKVDTLLMRYPAQGHFLPKRTIFLEEQRTGQGELYCPHFRDEQLDMRDQFAFQRLPRKYVSESGTVLVFPDSQTTALTLPSSQVNGNTYE